MTTLADIITQAYREANILSIGKAPTDDEKAEALPRLNNYIGTLFGMSIGEHVKDWLVPPSRTAPVAARYPLSPRDDAHPAEVWRYPPQNKRLVTKITSSTTVYFPFRPDDGARMTLADAGSTADLTIDANGRKIEGSATLTLTPATVAEKKWFFRGDKADWIEQKVFADTDDSPFPVEFDDLLVTGLAIRLAPRFQKDVTRETVAANQNAEKAFRTRYWQSSPGEVRDVPGVPDSEHGLYGR